MGFFSDLKEDLAQAVNELTEDTAEKELLEEEQRLKEELASMEGEFQINGVDKTEALTEDELEHFLEEEAVYVTEEEADALLKDISQKEVEDTMEDVSVPEADSVVNEEVIAELAAQYEMASVEAKEEATMEVTAEEEEIVQIEETVEEIEELEEIEDAEMVQEEKTFMSDMTYNSMADENAEVGIIPAGMIITGDITTAGALDLKGTVLGNIEIGGKLNISGSIQGNAKAVEVYAQAAKITGDIECDNSVKVGPNSVVIGNINARSAVIAGAVKGDIDVRGPVILDSSAIIMGNIKSKSVQINNGAAIEGMCSQCYADVNPSSFFDGIADK